MSDEESRGAREVSKVQFPYYDLQDSIEIARAMHGAGGVPLDRDQLGAATGLAPSGGNFATKISAARMFGFVEISNNKFQLTNLGFDVLDPARERSAKAEAFLNVELYRKAYEQFKGRTLPSRPVGLEMAFVNMGVASKQRDKARHVFDRSARTAGFFPNGNEDRLVQPVIGTVHAGGTVSQMVVPVRNHSENVVDLVDGSRRELVSNRAPEPAQGLDGVIVALIDKLPRGAGKLFPPKERTKWLTMMEMALEMAYGDNPSE